MDRFKLMLVFQIGVFGIVVLKCPAVEGKQHFYVNVRSPLSYTYRCKDYQVDGMY